MYVAPESKVLFAMANVAATSETTVNGGGDTVTPDDEF